MMDTKVEDIEMRLAEENYQNNRNRIKDKKLLREINMKQCPLYRNGCTAFWCYVSMCPAKVES